MKQFGFAHTINEESLMKHSSQSLETIMSNPIVEKLYEERNTLWEQMKELNDREISENRSLDSAEKEQWDKMNDRMSEIDSRVNELALSKNLTKKQKKQGLCLNQSLLSKILLKLKKLMDKSFVLLLMEKFVLTTLKRDLTKSGDGGLVPQSFFDQIIAKLDENAVVRQLLQ